MKRLILISVSIVLLTDLIFSQSVEIKDGEATPNTLIQINDEGSAGSITIPDASTVGTTTSKLYNEGGTLKWNGNTLATGGSSLWSSNGVKIYYSAGNVGIGTTNPLGNLDVRGPGIDDGATIKLGNSDMSHQITLFGGRQNDPNPFILWTENDPLRFATTAGGFTEIMRITATGNVGIGTITPDEKLHIAGNMRLNGTFEDKDGHSGTAGQILSSTATGTDWIEVSSSGGSNTLDQAYDEGGAGLGRTITADAGAFNVGGVDGVLFTGTYDSGTLPATSAGTRMMWYPKKAAFRAGSVNGSHWDDSSIGNYSTALGFNTIASGEASTALGHELTASGDYSTALGAITSASGMYSTAMGFETNAQAYLSTVLGKNNVGGGNETAWVATDPLFEIGIGTGLFDKENALTVRKNGNVGIGTATPLSILSVGGDGDSDAAIYSEASGTSGIGVYSKAGGSTGVGVYSEVSGTSGIGVHGKATSALSTNYGGYFEGDEYSGTGVYGNGAYGVKGNGSYGGYFTSNNHGVYGESTSTSIEAGAYGGYFTAASTGFGDISTRSKGVYGNASGGGGIGVYGEATEAATGPDGSRNYGGWFEAAGYYGIGVYGNAPGNGHSVLGNAYGGLFNASGTHGIGVKGIADGEDGIGVYGAGNASDFWAASGTYGNSSSIRWKKNIVEIDNPLEKLSEIQGVYFDWDEEHGGKHSVGFIAEEVGKVMPEIVFYEENGIDAKGMDYTKITPLLVEAVKAQQELIVELMERINTLESR